MFHVKHAGRPRHAGPACRGAPEGASRGGESLAENGAGPPVASSAAAYALGIRDTTCELAASRSPDGWPPVHEQHWRGRTTKVRMSGRIAQAMVARHPLPLPESERFARHPSPLATLLRRERASSTEGGASEARGKGAQTELSGQGRGGAAGRGVAWRANGSARQGRDGAGGAAGRGKVGAVAVGRGTRRGRGGQGGGRDGKRMGGVGTQTELPGQGRGAAGSPGGRMGARGGVVGRRVGRGEPQGGATKPARRRSRDRDGGCAGGGRSASAASGQHLSGEGGRTAPRADGGQGCRHSASGKSEQAAATARLTGRRPSVS